MIPLDSAPPAGVGRFLDRGPGERSAGPGEVELSLAARAVICVCSLERGRPILSARRDRPNKPEDSGWQFLCGSTGHKPEHGRQVSLQQVLALEASLSEWIHGPIGRRLLRRKAGDPWTAPMR